MDKQKNEMMYKEYLETGRQEIPYSYLVMNDMFDEVDKCEISKGTRNGENGCEVKFYGTDNGNFSAWIPYDERVLDDMEDSDKKSFMDMVLKYTTSYYKRIDWGMKEYGLSMEDILGEEKNGFHDVNDPNDVDILFGRKLIEKTGFDKEIAKYDDLKLVTEDKDGKPIFPYVCAKNPDADHPFAYSANLHEGRRFGYNDPSYYSTLLLTNSLIVPRQNGTGVDLFPIKMPIHRTLTTDPKRSKIASTPAELAKSIHHTISCERNDALFEPMREHLDDYRNRVQDIWKIMHFLQDDKYCNMDIEEAELNLDADFKAAITLDNNRPYFANNFARAYNALLKDKVAVDSWHMNPENSIVKALSEAGKVSGRKFTLGFGGFLWDNDIPSLYIESKDARSEMSMQKILQDKVYGKQAVINDWEAGFNGKETNSNKKSTTLADGIELYEGLASPIPGLIDIGDRSEDDELILQDYSLKGFKEYCDREIAAAKALPFIQDRMKDEMVKLYEQVANKKFKGAIGTVTKERKISNDDMMENAFNIEIDPFDTPGSNVICNAEYGAMALAEKYGNAIMNTKDLKTTIDQLFETDEAHKIMSEMEDAIKVGLDYCLAINTVESHSHDKKFKPTVNTGTVALVGKIESEEEKKAVKELAASVAKAGGFIRVALGSGAEDAAREGAGTHALIYASENSEFEHALNNGGYKELLPSDTAWIDKISKERSMKIDSAQLAAFGGLYLTSDGDCKNLADLTVILSKNDMTDMIEKSLNDNGLKMPDKNGNWLNACWYDEKTGSAVAALEKAKEIVDTVQRPRSKFEDRNLELGDRLARHAHQVLGERKTEKTMEKTQEQASTQKPHHKNNGRGRV